MKKPKAPAVIHPDSRALHNVIQAIITGMGTGGLTYVAGRLGMTPSAMRKRLHAPGGAFDPVTMRAVILVGECRATGPDSEAGQDIGPYRVAARQIDGQKVPSWRLRK